MKHKLISMTSLQFFGQLENEKLDEKIFASIISCEKSKKTVV